MSIPIAEIITIGTEIVLGDIINTNAPYLARKLRAEGIEVRRTWSIGDDLEEIAAAVREAAHRAEIIITTGGLGPTVDDPTRDAVALAFGTPTEYHPELWQQVVDRFARFGRAPTENNRKQAYLPQGAVPIENPLGTAPAFLMEYAAARASAEGWRAGGVLVALPGVPSEMEHLLEQAVLPYLREKFALNSVLLLRVIHTAGAGESQIDEKIAELETLTNPRVGLAAHSGQVDVRLVARAATVDEAQALIRPVEAEIRRRLGAWVYGADDETLEDQALRALAARGWHLAVVEGGIEGQLVQRFARENGVFRAGEIAPTKFPSLEDLWASTAAYAASKQSEVGLGVSLSQTQQQPEILLALITPEEEKKLRVPYGGPPQLATKRAVNLGIDLLRKVGQLR